MIQKTIRLDPEILEYFQAGGRGWQILMNKKLRKYVDEKKRSVMGIDRNKSID